MRNHAAKRDPLALIDDTLPCDSKMHLACMDGYRLAVLIKQGVKRDLDMLIVQKRARFCLESISLPTAQIAQFSSFARAISRDRCTEGVDDIINIMNQ